MQLTEKFKYLIDKQLESFGCDLGVINLVAYVAMPTNKSKASFEIIGQWPKNNMVLPPVDEDPELKAASPSRRWYPLQEDNYLIGVLRVEREIEEKDWPDVLDLRLLALATSLAQCISIELERKKLLERIILQKDQISMIIHQLRNPLAALRTYAKLLLKKIDPDSANLNLVEGILNEQSQIDKYIGAFEELEELYLRPNPLEGNRLLLPPNLNDDQLIKIKEIIEPLVERGSSRAKLEGHKWQGPKEWPTWTLVPIKSEYSIIAEILANLLENAFIYSDKSSTIGLDISSDGLCVWDQGKMIPEDEKKKIFNKGFRGKKSLNSSGTGIGLFVAKKLANKINSRLLLLDSPSLFNNYLPEKGNAFFLKIPVKKLLKKS
tara:strand:- start:16 stop:1149 length:1134 start_codon:yes stop_codon:yes gene_type:complete